MFPAIHSVAPAKYVSDIAVVVFQDRSCDRKCK